MKETLNASQYTDRLIYEQKSSRHIILVTNSSSKETSN